MRERYIINRFGGRKNPARLRCYSSLIYTYRPDKVALRKREFAAPVYIHARGCAAIIYAGHA